MFIVTCSFGTRTHTRTQRACSVCVRVHVPLCDNNMRLRLPRHTAAAAAAVAAVVAAVVAAAVAVAVAAVAAAQLLFGFSLLTVGLANGVRRMGAMCAATSRSFAWLASSESAAAAGLAPPMLSFHSFFCSRKMPGG